MPERETDQLYRVPLADFVRARDEVAARLKAAGDREGAAEVKRARKPSVPAWAANQVVWHATAEWERLRAAAGALRRAHEGGAGPDELRQAIRDQREALSACEARAAGFLVASGHAASPTVVQKASGTLQALAHGSSDAQAGRVQEELLPPGFELLAGMSLVVPAAGGGAVATDPGSAGSVPADGQPGDASCDRPPNGRVAALDASERPPREREERERRVAIEAAAVRLEQARLAVAGARTRVEGHEKRLRDLESGLVAERRACDAARLSLDSAEAEASAAEAALGALRRLDGTGQAL